MYAVIKTGGKQHTVKEGDIVKIEKLEKSVGDVITLEDVLLVADGEKRSIGAPFVKGAKVTAEVVSQGRHKKVKIIKFKRRKHHMKRQGHRQYFTAVKITGITTTA